mmetsp:Transcript_37057/g.46364  ORF Transcript_37057/g.46364 Transcript_37057/m.46364 type:complete len:441 (-) Transcript_37057:169-1491(-)
MDKVLRIHHAQVFDFLDLNNDIYCVRDVCKLWRKYTKRRWDKREILLLFRSCLNVPEDNLSIKNACVGIDFAAREYIGLPSSPATIHGMIYNQTHLACVNGKDLVVLAHTNSGLYVLRLQTTGNLRHWSIPRSAAKILSTNSCNCIKNCKCTRRCSPPLRLSTMGYAVATYQDRLFLVGGTSSFNGGGEVPSPFIWEYSLERNEVWRFASLRDPRIDPSAHIVKDVQNRPMLVVLGGHGKARLDSLKLTRVDAVYLDTGKRVNDMPDFPFLEQTYNIDPQYQFANQIQNQQQNERSHPGNYQGYSDIKWGTSTIQLGNEIILPWSPCRLDDAPFPVLDAVNKEWKEAAGIKFPSEAWVVDHWPLPRIVNGTLTLFLKANKILLSRSNYWAQTKKTSAQNRKHNNSKTNKRPKRLRNRPTTPHSHEKKKAEIVEVVGAKVF